MAFVLAAIVALAMTALAQTSKAEVEVSPPNEQGYQRAEIALANTDALVHTTKDKAFIIAHLGSGETSPSLNARRLACIKDLFSGFDPQKVILAEGHRVRGPARVEMFLGSELMHVALIARNGNICTVLGRKNATDRRRGADRVWH